MHEDKADIEAAARGGSMMYTPPLSPAQQLHQLQGHPDDAAKLGMPRADYDSSSSAYDSSTSVDEASIRVNTEDVTKPPVEAPSKPAPKPLDVTDAALFKFIIAGGVLLSFNGGFINSITLQTKNRTVVSHVTGHATKAAIELGTLNMGDFMNEVALLVFFGFGASITGWMIGKEKFTLGQSYGRLMVTIGSLIFIAMYSANVRQTAPLRCRRRRGAAAAAALRRRRRHRAAAASLVVTTTAGSVAGGTQAPRLTRAAAAHLPPPPPPPPPLHAGMEMDNRGEKIYHSVYLLAIACGMQNAMTTRYSGAVVRTTHLTGMTTDVGLTVGHLMRKDRDYADLWKLTLFVPMILGFFFGGVIAIPTYNAWRMQSLWPCVLLLFGGGFAYVLFIARHSNISFMRALVRPVLRPQTYIPKNMSLRRRRRRRRHMSAHQHAGGAAAAATAAAAAAQPGFNGMHGQPDMV
ncbi:hypothetical protein JKP88DRAFT_248126 [Tribonema minus]|uniref:Uncharacterized protein n=1 Tax=Tribonema minus TaxID=303371 RepID=A0A835YP53_9STRA|nr:hypothetical protein JKP88DRAFT_248126 [Tribonema minus]